MAGRTGRVMSERCKASLISWYPPPQSRNDKWKVWLKSLGILIDAVTRHPRNLAALPRKFFFLWQYDIKRIGEAFWKRSYARVVEAAMLHDDAVHCIFAGAGKTRGPLHLCVLALGYSVGEYHRFTKAPTARPEYKPARCKHLKFCLPSCSRSQRFRSWRGRVVPSLSLLTL